MYKFVIGVILIVIGIVLIYVWHKKRAFKNNKDMQRRSRKRPSTTIFLIIGSIVTLLGLVTVGTTLISNTTESTAVEVLKINPSTVTMKNGKAKVDIELAKDTKLKIRHVDNNVDDVSYSAKKDSQKLTVTFVVAGTYELVASDKKNTVTKKIKVNKAKSSASKKSNSQTTEGTPNPVNGEMQTNIVTEPPVEQVPVQPEPPIAPEAPVEEQVTPPVAENENKESTVSVTPEAESEATVETLPDPV